MTVAPSAKIISLSLLNQFCQTHEGAGLVGGQTRDDLLERGELREWQPNAKEHIP